MLIEIALYSSRRYFFLLRFLFQNWEKKTEERNFQVVSFVWTFFFFPIHFALSVFHFSIWLCLIFNINYVCLWNICFFKSNIEFKVHKIKPRGGDNWFQVLANFYYHVDVSLLLSVKRKLMMKMEKMVNSVIQLSNWQSFFHLDIAYDLLVHAQILSESLSHYFSRCALASVNQLCSVECSWIVYCQPRLIAVRHFNLLRDKSWSTINFYGN